MRFLLEKEVSVNSRGGNGSTALIWAANEGFVDIAQLLLDMEQ